MLTGRVLRLLLSGVAPETILCVTFTKAGTYEYICMLHDEIGMSGHVTVLSAGSMPGMPRTGYADVLPVVAGLGALGLLFGGFMLRRRSALRTRV